MANNVQNADNTALYSNKSDMSTSDISVYKLNESDILAYDISIYDISEKFRFDVSGSDISVGDVSVYFGATASNQVNDISGVDVYVSDILESDISVGDVLVALPPTDVRLCEGSVCACSVSKKFSSQVNLFISDSVLINELSGPHSQCVPLGQGRRNYVC